MTGYWIFRTKAGLAGVAGTGQGIKLLLLPGRPKKKIAARILSACPEARPGRAAPKAARDAIKTVQEYFRGSVRIRAVKLDLCGRTEFQKRVLAAARKIKPGQVRTYSWVAKKAGRPEAFRAAAQALAQNPVPLFIPCHRVIGKDGSLTGFSAPGGLKLKKLMLEIEKSRGRVSPPRT